MLILNDYKKIANIDYITEDTYNKFLEVYNSSNWIEAYNYAKSFDDKTFLGLFLILCISDLSIRSSYRPRIPINLWKLEEFRYYDFLKMLKFGYLCPICGSYYTKITKHLDYIHNLSFDWWLLKFNNVTKVPTCAHPRCSNKVGYNNFRFNETCSISCGKSLYLLRKYGEGAGENFGYWSRTEYNNDPIKYPEYYVSDEEMRTHNKSTEIMLCSQDRADKRVETFLRKYGTRFPANYWSRTEYNNDPIKYPEYFISDEEMIFHNDACTKAYTDPERYKETNLRKYGTQFPPNTWRRTEWNNDKEKYPFYYLSDEEIDAHNREFLKRSFRNSGFRPIKVIFNGNSLELKSSWEFLTLAYLLLVMKLSYDDIEYEKRVKDCYPDFYIKSEDRFIDPHPSITLDEKIESYKHLNINIEYWDEDKIESIHNELNNYLDKLPLDKIDSGKLYLYSEDFCFDFDNWKLV